ncbi:MAG: TonB family protein [Deltaproteobacteria bacterium]|nr:TonB family protein [Deltaproteobacteria bacterium]
MYELRIAAFVVASLLLHWALFDGLERLPDQQKAAKQVVMFQVTQPPPPAPEPPPPTPQVPDELTPQPPPPKVPPKAPLRDSPAKPRPPSPIDHPPPPDTPQKDVQPSERAPTPGATGEEPVFGVDMASTSEAGAGPAVPVGNQIQTSSDGTAKDPKKVKPLAPSLPPPVPAHQVEKAPEMKDRDLCRGQYTEEARQAAIEGSVVLDLVVGEDGKAREIKVVKGLGHGLDQAAVAALQRCPFQPGLRDGKPVPVRIRSFKVSFYLRDDE